MSKTRLIFILPVLLFLILIHDFPGGGNLLLAQDDSHLEVGGALPLTEGEAALVEGLNILDSQFDVSVQYTRFTGEDMRDSYEGMPVVAAGYSCLISPATRFFLSLGYGETTGDPFHGIPGISSADRIKVRYAPMLLGMKVDLAKSTRVHVFVGAALEFAWMQETVPLLTEGGDISDTPSSGLNSGYQVVFGPQFVLGKGGQTLGLEVGYGGSKGRITSKGHRHNLDLTGYRGRLYLALAL